MDKKRVQTKIPSGVIISCIVGILFALFIFATLLIFSLASLIGGGRLDVSQEQHFEAAAISIISLVVGLAQFVIPYGLWKMKKWALYAEIAICLFFAVSSLFVMLLFGAILNATDLVLLVAPVAVVYYLISNRRLFS
jgi:hypothetical protein